MNDRFCTSAAKGPDSWRFCYIGCELRSCRWNCYLKYAHFLVIACEKGRNLLYCIIYKFLLYGNLVKEDIKKD